MYFSDQPNVLPPSPHVAVASRDSGPKMSQTTSATPAVIFQPSSVPKTQCTAQLAPSSVPAATTSRHEPPNPQVNCLISLLKYIKWKSRWLVSLQCMLNRLNAFMNILLRRMSYLFVSIIRLDLYRLPCVSVHARFASLLLDWGHHLSAT